PGVLPYCVISHALAGTTRILRNSFAPITIRRGILAKLGYDHVQKGGVYQCNQRGYVRSLNRWCRYIEAGLAFAVMVLMAGIACAQDVDATSSVAAHERSTGRGMRPFASDSQPDRSSKTKSADSDASRKDEEDRESETLSGSGITFTLQEQSEVWANLTG